MHAAALTGAVEVHQQLLAPLRGEDARGCKETARQQGLPGAPPSLRHTALGVRHVPRRTSFRYGPPPEQTAMSTESGYTPAFHLSGGARAAVKRSAEHRARVGGGRRTCL